MVAVSGSPELMATIDEAAVAVTGSEIVTAAIDAAVLGDRALSGPLPGSGSSPGPPRRRPGRGSMPGVG